MPLPLAAIAMGASIAGGLSKLSFRKNRAVNVKRSPLADDQRDFARLMRARASGAGTSYADLQMRAAYDRAMGQASGMAAGARGVNAGLAMRQAQMAGASAAQGIAAEGAQARIQEEQQQSSLAMSALNQAASADDAYYQARAHQQAQANALEAQRRAGNRAAVSDGLLSLGAGLGRKAELDRLDLKQNQMMDQGFNPYTGDYLGQDYLGNNQTTGYNNMQLRRRG
jgi:hypothetical protein